MATQVIRAQGKAKDVLSAVKQLAEEYPDKTIGDFKTCRHCGLTGLEVKTTSIHIGGLGYIKYDYCQDIRACFVRQDKKESRGSRK